MVCVGSVLKEEVLGVIESLVHCGLGLLGGDDREHSTGSPSLPSPLRAS